MVDGARGNLLAGARLAGDQHRDRVLLCHDLERAAQVFGDTAWAEVERCVRLRVAQLLHLAAQRVLFCGAVD